jgi:tetratricopeptide (TPR) repeat protein
MLSHIERRAEYLSPMFKAPLLARIATLQAFHDPQRGIALGEEAVSVAKDTGDVTLMLQCTTARGIAKMVAGSYDAALTDFARAEELSKEDFGDLLFPVHTNRACIYFGRGEIAKAEIEHNKAMSCVGREKMLPRMNVAAGYLGFGRAADAIPIIRGILHENQILQSTWVELAARSLLGWALIECGMHEEAFECERIVKPLFDTKSLPIYDWSYTTIFLAKAAEQRQDIAAAREIFESALASHAYQSLFGRTRVELAFADLLRRSDVDLAYHYAKSAAANAERSGSAIMRERANNILNSIRDR